MATESLEVTESNGALYARITMADGKTRAAGYQVLNGDTQAARNQCAADLGNQVEHYVRTGEWL